MLKKANRNRDAADIKADDPSKAMDQFAAGLRRVLAAPKPKTKSRTRPRIARTRT